MSAAPERRLWLVRHAKPLLPPGVCYGQLDVAGDPAETAAVARRLLMALPPAFDLWHSPLQRCELLELNLRAQQAFFTTTPDPRLKELNFGRWEGQRWDAIARDELEQWTLDFADYPPGGGESLRSMLARVQQALAEVMSDRQPTRDMVWVTHAGVIRCVHWLCSGATQLPEARQWRLSAPGFGQWIALPVHRLSLSNVSH